MVHLSAVSFAITNTGDTPIVCIREDGTEDPIPPLQTGRTYTQKDIYKVFILNDDTQTTLFAVTFSDTGLNIINGADSPTTAKAIVTVEME
jgi:hypothetical protein